ISLAMFGITIGSLFVYYKPQVFSQERLKEHLAQYSLLSAIAMVVSLIAHFYAPYIEPTGFGILALTYVTSAIPFVFIGICFSLVLTRFPLQISKLYATDLLGSAFGCFLLVFLLSKLDAPLAVFAVALFASVGAIFFSFDAEES